MQNYRPFTGITPAVKILLILNIVMYFLSMFIDSRMHVDTAHLLGLHLPQSVFWRPWQYVARRLAAGGGEGAGRSRHPAGQRRDAASGGLRAY